MTFSISKTLTRRAATRELVEMLSTRRPARSKTEERFISTYLDTLPNVKQDDHGNRIIKIGKAPRVLWSSHTDTVHNKDGVQSVARNGNLVQLHKDESVSSCLGGDDSAGVWIMRQMILRRIPGLYVFHRDEEVGGFGSTWIAEHTPELFKGIDYAIALDRKGYDSVITHQGSRCASDEFARDLAAQLGGAYKPDSTGVFTDTANYTGLVPECSNLSCGYGNAHTATEFQDVVFAYDLLERLCALDFNKIRVARDPNSFDDYPDDDFHGYSFGFLDGRSKVKSAKRKQSYRRDNIDELIALCCSDPCGVADYLDQLGVNAYDLDDFLKYDVR